LLHKLEEYGGRVGHSGLLYKCGACEEISLEQLEPHPPASQIDMPAVNLLSKKLYGKLLQQINFVIYIFKRGKQEINLYYINNPVIQFFEIRRIAVIIKGQNKTFFLQIPAAFNQFRGEHNIFKELKANKVGGQQLNGIAHQYFSVNIDETPVFTQGLTDTET